MNAEGLARNENGFRNLNAEDMTDPDIPFEIEQPALVVAQLFMTVQYTCKHCGAEIDVDVTINEEDDLPEKCPDCDTLIPDSAHSDVQITAMEKADDLFDQD